MINMGFLPDSTRMIGFVKENFDCFYSNPNLNDEY